MAIENVLASPINWTLFNKIYSYARKNIPFYKSYYADQPNHIYDIDDFRHLPVLQKKHLREMKIHQIKCTNSSRVYWTGGTSGLSETVEWYDNQLEKTLHSFDHYFSSMHILPGDYLLSTISGNMGILGTIIDRLCIRWKLSNISLGSSSKAYLDYIKHFIRLYAPKIIFTTPQGAVRIASHLKKESINSNRGTIITSGAFLTNRMRKFVTDAMHVKILNHYGCTEVGPCGIEERTGEGFSLSPSNVVAEVHNPDDYGTGEILLTSLCNFRQPIIRYYVGDFGYLAKKGKHTRLHIQRRMLETIYIGGTKLDVLQIDVALEKLNCHIPYQVVHKKENDYEVLDFRIVGHSPGLEPAKLLKCFSTINPALYAKAVSRSLVFKVTEISADRLTKAKGDKYPRLLSLWNLT